MKQISALLSIAFFISIHSFAQIIYVPTDQPTIQSAINASVDGDTVLVADGTYFENINFKGKAITVASHFLVDRDATHIDNTIINGSQSSNTSIGSVVMFESGEDTTSVLCGFTITGGSGSFNLGHRVGGGIVIGLSGAKIIYNKIVYNSVVSSSSGGGGILVYDPNNSCFISNNFIAYNEETSISISGAGGGIHIGEDRNKRVLITNNYIAHNKSSPSNSTRDDKGGGISLIESASIIRNNIIVFNEANEGGGLHIYDTNISGGAIIENNIIAYNHARINWGGGIGASTESDPLKRNPIRNCIIWGNTAADELNQINRDQEYIDKQIEYSLIQGSYIGTSIIDQDPGFLDTVLFHIDPLSPCIDAGNPAPIFNDIQDANNLSFARYPALGELRNDIGAFGGPNSKWSDMELLLGPTGIKYNEKLIKQSFQLFQNYPNPFNPSTIIKYSIPSQSNVTLKVFDVLGRELSTLVNKEQPQGSYEIEVDGSKLSSGIYFYRLKAGDFVETKKMILMK